MMLDSARETPSTEATTTVVPRAECLDKDAQTVVDYPTVTEVIKEVEVVREVPIREDPDKIDNTDVSIDEKGHYRIFESTNNPDDPMMVDQLSQEFLARTKVSQI